MDTSTKNVSKCTKKKLKSTWYESFDCSHKEAFFPVPYLNFVSK